MVTKVKYEEIFLDAESVYEAALRELKEGKIRDAAEKGWCATVRAAAAFIQARTGEVPQRADLTTQHLHGLMEKEKKGKRIMYEYYTRMHILHGNCFYMGACEPRERVERLIRQTGRLIRELRKLAGTE